MKLHLRGERADDADAIDIVNCRAFRSMDEAHIVRLMRDHHPAFDPRYSITAWDGGELVGHALFTPARLRLMGRYVASLALGPIAVLPERQGQGIGGELIRYGHALGRREGAELAFLHGHPSYYPRHGYVRCAGLARIQIEIDRLPAPRRELRCMPVQDDDVRWLSERWSAEWDGVDFAWSWGTDPGEWTLRGLSTVVWWTGKGRRAGYVCKFGVCAGHGLVLAEDAELVPEILARARLETLQQHPAGWLARNGLDPAWSDARVERNDAVMACELRDGVLDPVLRALESGERLPGFALFPLPFLLC